MKRPETRPASAEDIERFYGRRLPHSVAAHVAVLDGEPIGVVGLMFDPRGAYYFSDLRPEMRRWPMTIVRGVRAFLADVGETNAPAIADTEEPGAPRLLSLLGFDHVTSTAGGEVFVYAGH